MVMRKLTNNLLAVVIALFAVFAIIQYQNTAELWQEKSRELTPADNWFVIRGVTIPDFVVGTDPVVQFNRVIRQPFDGSWSISIHQVGSDMDYPICFNSSTNFYDATPGIPKTAIPLSIFMGKECALPVGQYIAQINWEIRPAGYPTKYVRISSNNFYVKPESKVFNPDTLK